jgi:hypothetical protein
MQTVQLARRAAASMQKVGDHVSLWRGTLIPLLAAILGMGGGYCATHFTQLICLCPSHCNPQSTVTKVLPGAQRTA